MPVDHESCYYFHKNRVFLIRARQVIMEKTYLLFVEKYSIAAI